MYLYISILLFILGLTLIISPNTILSQDSDLQKRFHDNSKLLGGTLIAGAYYTYSISNSDSPTTPYLPSYDEATSTEQ